MRYAFLVTTIQAIGMHFLIKRSGEDSFGMQIETVQLCPEAELLQLCIAPKMTPEKTQRWRDILDAGLDWDNVIKSARNHRIVPLLYRSVATITPNMIPDDALEKLRISNLINIRRNISLTRELFNVLDKLEANGISAMPFKGPILASTAYGDLLLRQFDDLDILVKPGNVEEVDRLLTSIGYQQETPIKVSKAQAAAMQKYQHHHHFYSPVSRVHLEVHWTLSPELYSMHQDTANLWNRSELVELENRKVRGLSAENTLVLICDHAARHQWNRLAWLCDVSMLLCTKILDWEIVMNQAIEWKSKRALLLGLFLAKDLLGAPLPDDIQKMIMEDRLMMALASHAIDQLFPNGRASQMSPSDHVLRNIQDQLFYIKARDRLLDRAKLYINLATTPTVEDWSSLPLPDQLFFLYYLVRPVRQAYAYRTKILNWMLR